MKRLSSYAGGLAAFFAALTLIEIRSLWTVWLAVPKLLAGSLTPLAATLGTLGAVFGWLSGHHKAMWTGLLSAAVSIRHIARVSAAHDGFDHAFGPGWQTRLPPDRRARMLSRRWSSLAPEPPLVPFERDVVFDHSPESGDALLCDVWQPPASVPPSGLGIIYLHGSGWHFFDKDIGTRHFFRHLAGQGHVIMDVAYTLAPRVQLPGMLGDVKRAIAWLKTRGADFGVKPDRVVLMGGSAGGHLSLLAAYTPNDPEFQPSGVQVDTSVRAVVSYYGPPDLRAIHEHARSLLSGFMSSDTWLGRSIVTASGWVLKVLFPGSRIVPPYGKMINGADVVVGLLGGTPDEVPQRYRAGSPIHHVGPHCPPTLLLQGRHDFAVKPGPVRRLHRALREAGATSIYVEFPQTDHAFDLFFPSVAPAAQAATYDTERFLALMM